MRRQSLRKQAAILTGANMLTRAGGFLLRILTARWLGAEALGISELASSVQTLFILPAAAGLPTAVSRLTAKYDDRRAFAEGRRLARRVCLCLMLLSAACAPLMSGWTGDRRTLPALIAFSPCVLIVGVSCVYNGYCYGSGSAWPPALSECLEQLTRMLTLVAVLTVFPSLSVSYKAAAPALCALVGEGAGLILVKRMTHCAREKANPDAAMRSEILRHSLPLSAMRFLTGLSRTGCGLLIPFMLKRAGADDGEAARALGLLMGMAMPLVYLPGMLTGALAVIGAPAMAAREADRKRLRHAAAPLIAIAAGAGLACAGGIYLLADLIANRLYGAYALAPVLRAIAPAAFFFAMQQLSGSLLSGLGHSRKTFLCSLCGSLVTLLFTAVWTGPLGVVGAARACALGGAAGALSHLCALLYAL